MAGTLEGLSADGLILSNGADLVSPTKESSIFIFPNKLANLVIYEVKVKTHPTNQTCSVQNGFGSVTNQSVTNIKIVCINNPGSLGGKISGLTTNGLILINGSEELTVASGSSSFQFGSTVPDGAIYSIKVKTQPAGNSCVLTNFIGVMTSPSVSNVQVTCSEINPLITTLPALPSKSLQLGDNQRIAVGLDGSIYLIRRVLYQQTSQFNDFINKLFVIKPSDTSWQETAFPIFSMPPGIYPWGLYHISLPRALNGNVFAMQLDQLCLSTLGNLSFTCSKLPNYRGASTNLSDYSTELNYSPPPEQRSDKDFDVSPTNPDLRIQGMDNGSILKITDNGRSQSVVKFYDGPFLENGYERRIRSVNFSPANSRRVWASGAEGILRSDDEGDSWIVVEPTPTEKLAINKTGLILVGLRKNGIIYSKDEGVTWNFLLGSFGYSIAWSPVEENVFYSISQNTIFKIEIR